MGPIDKYIPLLEKLQENANQQDMAPSISKSKPKEENNTNVDDHFTLNMLKNDLILLK